MSAILKRSTLRTSRLLDFASEKELVAQTGHRREEWPLVILKELADNAIDACEEVGVAPVIKVKVTDAGIEIADNGPGLPGETIKGVLDFAVRISSREAYVSPSRGAQGNAWKTVVAMPYVLDGEHGRVEIDARGVRHVIDFGVDHIRQEPKIEHREEASDVKVGTVVRILWPDSSRSILAYAEARFLQIASDFAWLNPHLSISVDWFGERHQGTATDRNWAKWKPSDPTSPHWYTADHLERLIRGYLADDADRGRDRTVRELISEFRGLSGTAKQKVVLEMTRLSRAPLSQLVNGDRVNREAVESLLEAMQLHSEPVKPKMLGIIGRDHFRALFEQVGCEPDSFDYRRVMEVDDGVPWIIETAFGWCPERETRRLVTGVNWSASIINPFRQLGGYRSLDSVLAEQRANASEPVILAVHVACPRVEYLDRGKSAVVMSSCKADTIIGGVERVTKKWAKQRKREEREHAAVLNRANAFQKRTSVSIKEAAWSVMEQAYLKASGGGRLPANARQIMYAGRPEIQRLASRNLGSDFDHYFTQRLLPDYVAEHGIDEWNVVFDARGHFVEPHTDKVVPLGTLAVRDYLASVADHRVDSFSVDIREDLYPTCGPKNRYSSLVYCEKEGFDPIFADAQLAERLDAGFMSSKGMSVTAARELAQEICAEYGLTLFVLHDFDVSGFSIFGTLRSSTRRFQFKRQFEVVDLGLRLEDIDGLDREKVPVRSPERVSMTLRKHGATEAEIQILLKERVELNAMPSDQLVAWIERKLLENGVKKIVPDSETISDAYARMRRQALAQERVDEILNQAEKIDVAVPDDLQTRLREALESDPAQSWDQILHHIAEDDHNEAAS